MRTTLPVYLLWAAFAVGCAPAASPDSNPLKPIEKIEPIPEAGSTRVTLDIVMTLHKEVATILENVVDLPVGAVVEVPPGYTIKNLDYRDTDGSISRSSTGFVTPLTLISVPASAGWPQSKIDAINQTAGGLYVSARIVGAIEGAAGNFAAMPTVAAEPPYLTNYDAAGKPKFDYSATVIKRFGPHLNKGVDPAKMSTGDRERYQKIYAELVRVGSRKVETPKALLLIDNALAMKLSEEYENTRAVPVNGAWSVAVNGTAVRHGFENVPCAEFMSEVLREAYQRAGYRVTDDFNPSRGNELIWTRTAAVQLFSQSLYDAGWIPWDTRKFKPPVGAFLMNGAGTTPGHTYLAGGDEGRLIVDNGSPQGRDLRKTTQKIIEMMYQTGVFFLPPGINPDPW